MLVNRVLFETFLQQFPDQKRATGRTTGLALLAIGQALGAPRLKVTVHDHHGTNQADDMLLTMIAEIIRKLDLKHFKLVKGNVSTKPYLTYNPFVEVEL